MNLNLRKSLPNWLSLGVLAAIVIGGFVLVGWIKPYLTGPDLGNRPKPVPVPVETVKWMTKVKKERVEVPVEVIREVPAKIEKRLDEDFGIRLPELRAENKELVDILGVPKAPHGGEMALTVNTDTGKIDGIFRPKRAPFIAVGGVREAGVEYDALNTSAIGYYRQDLVRIGPAIVSGRVFATAPIAPGGAAGTYGAAVGVSVRF